jgi:hypothetical protein
VVIILLGVFLGSCYVCKRGGKSLDLGIVSYLAFRDPLREAGQGMTDNGRAVHVIIRTRNNESRDAPAISRQSEVLTGGALSSTCCRTRCGTESQRLNARCIVEREYGRARCAAIHEDTEYGEVPARYMQFESSSQATRISSRE